MRQTVMPELPENRAKLKTKKVVNSNVMDPKLKRLLIELEDRMNQGGLSQKEAAQWVGRLHLFTRKAPSSKRQIWSPDGSGYIQINLTDEIKALSTEKLKCSRLVAHFFRVTSALTIGDVCQLSAHSFNHCNTGVKTLRELVALLRALEAGDLSSLKS